MKPSFRHWRWCAAWLVVLGLAGCAWPDKPVRAALYDLGPAPDLPMSAGDTTGEALLLADVATAGPVDSAAVLYRLAYADAHQLRPYALARWSLPPAQLVQRRLQEILARQQPVLAAGEGTPAVRAGERRPRVLRLALEEFAQHFESPARSAGVLRLRATLLESTGSGERLLAQRSFVARPLAPSADASGGVLALAAATDQVGGELAAWLRSQR